MSPNKLRALHRQVGLLASIWLVFAALSTLVINHRDLWLRPATAEEGPYGQYLLSHAFCASQPDCVLVGTSKGLFFSEDGGKSFRSVTLPVDAREVVAVAFHPNEPSHYYAVLRNEGIFSSLDNGKLWTRIAFPSQSPIQSFQVGFDGSLSVLSKEGLHRRIHEDWTLTPRSQSAAAGASTQSRQLVSFAYSLHDGSLWGPLGLLLTDLVAVSLLLLVATGWMMWRALGKDPQSPR